MNIEEAKLMLEELGEIYVVALEQRGHKVDTRSPIVNGLAAYYMLELKGEFEGLDKGVDEIIRIIYEDVVRKLSPAGIGES